MTDELEQLKADNASMKLALQSLMQTQGIIMRGDEYIPYRWAREAAEYGLGLRDELKAECTLPTREDIGISNYRFAPWDEFNSPASKIDVSSPPCVHCKHCGKTKGGLIVLEKYP